MKRGTLYDYSAIEKFISHLCDNGWECYNVWEGCLTSGDWICVAPDDKHYNFIIKEVYLNEWSSAQTVRRCAKLSDKKIEKVAFYENELSVRKNLISFIEQTFNGNFNFWTYPNNMKEIKTSKYGSLVYERNGEMYIARSRFNK